MTRWGRVIDRAVLNAVGGRRRGSRRRGSLSTRLPSSSPAPSFSPLPLSSSPLSETPHCGAHIPQRGEGRVGMWLSLSTAWDVGGGHCQHRGSVVSWSSWSWWLWLSWSLSWCRGVMSWWPWWCCGVVVLWLLLLLALSLLSRLGLAVGFHPRGIHQVVDNDDGRGMVVVVEKDVGRNV